MTKQAAVTTKHSLKGKFSFSNRVAPYWNILTENGKRLHNISILQDLLDKENIIPSRSMILTIETPTPGHAIADADLKMERKRRHPPPDMYCIECVSMSVYFQTPSHF